jgi:Ca2+-binding RTX toxin-like protein
MLMGDIGRDYLSGTPGVVKSVLAGMAGNDRLFGGAAADLLLGGSGSDRLDGGSGTDRLSGGTGRDVLTGGGQADTFIFNPRGGLDTIRDFTEGLDLIQIASAKSLSDLTFTDLGDDVQIDFATVHLIVENIEIADLAVAGNFLGNDDPGIDGAGPERVVAGGAVCAVRHTGQSGAGGEIHHQPA